MRTTFFRILTGIIHKSPYTPKKTNLSKRDYAGVFALVLALITVFAQHARAAAGYSAAVQADGPIAYWRFNDAPPTAVNSGSLGAGADGTYTGSATAGAQAPKPPAFVGFEANNTALQCDGATAFVTASSLMNSRPLFTISGWMRRNGPQNSRTGLWGQNDIVEFGYIDNTSLELWTDDGLHTCAATPCPAPFPDGEWAHIAVVSGGSPGTAYLYTNGVLAGTRAHTLPADNAFPFNIGGGGVFDTIDVNGNYFNGQIDEVAIFDKALTAAQIAAQYQGAFTLFSETNVFAPGDPIVLVNGVNDGDADAGPPPATESVDHSIDRVTQKYLNFLDLGSGFATTPSLGPTIVQSIRFYTANDAEERDPASFVLEGSVSGLDGPWTTIASGPLSLPSGRNAGGAIAIDPVTQFNQRIDFANNLTYSSYRVTFPTLKNAGTANSMQIAEVELLGSASAAAPRIVSQPASLTLREGLNATFSATVDGSPPLALQWFVKKAADPDFTAIPGANAASYVTPPTLYPDDDNAQFKLQVSNVFGTVESQVATLHVNEDLTPPTIAAASGSADFLHITLLFSEEVQGAEDPFLYSVDGGLAVTIAALSADRKSVTLTLDPTTPETANTVYTVTVNGVLDLANNPIAQDSTISFLSWIYTDCAGLIFEAYRPLSTSDNSLNNTLLADPNFPDNPQEVLRMTTFDSRAVYPDDTHDGYGARIRGLFIPPISGNWVFYLASDDSSRLFLNPNGVDAAGKVLIAEETGCCHGWTGGPWVSAPQALQAGQGYYLEAIYKEGGGGDYCKVAARLESEPAPEDDPNQQIPVSTNAIPGIMLGSPAAPAGIAGQITITQPPTDQTIEENRSATFCVQAENPSGLFCYQWSLNGSPIPGATARCYTTPLAQLADEGAVYSVTVGLIGADSVTPASAVLHVTLDTTPPQVVSVVAETTFTSVLVEYDELVEEGSATDPFVYNFEDLSDNSTFGAASGEMVTPTKVRIYTKAGGAGVALKLGGEYRLTIAGVNDLAVPPNVVDTNVTFRTPGVTPGYALKEYYLNIGSGVTVPDLTNNAKFPNSPDLTCYVSTWALNTVDEYDSSGARISGYFIPDVSGDYKFYVAADDGAALFLSTDSSPENRVLIAQEPGWAPRRAWTGNGGGDTRGGTSPNISAPIPLVAGQVYYMESLMKEGGGGDNMDVAVQGPGEPVPVNGSPSVGSGRIGVAAYPPAGGTITITQQPQDTTGTESETVTFTVAASGPANPPCGGGVTYQWRKNGAPILGANGASYTTPFLRMTDNGAAFDVLVRVPGLEVASAVAVLTVLHETVPPQLVSAASANGKQIGVRFSEPVRAESADPFAWVVNAGVSEVGTVALWPAGATESTEAVITLAAGSQPVLGEFMVECHNLVDVPGNVNTSATVVGKRWLESVDPLGAPNPPGVHFTAAEGEIQITTGGGDMWGNTDSGTFAWKRAGNFDVNARVDRLDYVGSLWSKAGLNARKSLSPNSQVLAWIYPNPTTGANQNEYARRQCDGCDITDVNGVTGTTRPNINNFPYWVRVRRVGNLVTGYYSRDGSTWNLNATANDDLSSYGYPAELLLGVALTPNMGNDGTATTAKYFFSNTILFPNAVITVTGPADATVDTSVGQDTAVFTVAATVTGAAPENLWYSWEQENPPGSGLFAPVPGAYSATLTRGGVSWADNGRHFRAVVSAEGSVPTYSRAALLTVIRESIPPQALSAQSSATFDTITVRFNEPLGVIGDAFTYEVQGPGGPVPLMQVRQGVNNQEVVLVLTSLLQPDTDYTVGIPGGVFDIAGNEIAPTSLTFRTFTLSPGFARRELYLNIGTGVAISDLTGNAKYPNSPDLVDFNTVLEGPTDYSDGYGIRVSGYLRPTVSGVYDFYISSDDLSQFWLSTDANPADKVLLCSEPEWNGSRQWLITDRRDAAAPQNRSLTLFPNGISLTAGQLYYYETLMKEGGGGDNVGVAVAMHGGTPPANGSTPIPGAFNLVVSADRTGASVNITQQPQDVVVGTGCRGSVLASQDFNAGNGGFTIENGGAVEQPWAYDAASGSWKVNGSEGVGAATYSLLNSPAYAVTLGGEVTLSLVHRYSFECDGWDGGQIRVSKNGGAYETVPNASISQNGYNAVIAGSGILNGQEGFNCGSANYGSGTYGEFIETTASLGVFAAGDTVSVQFVGCWDEYSRGSAPNWQIDTVSLTQGVASGATPPNSPYLAVAATGAITGNGNHPLFVQWQKNGVDIPGANRLTYYPQISPADSGSQYRAVVSVPGATAVSDSATFTLDQAPQVAITSPPNGSSTTSCGAATIVATASDPDGTVAKVGFYVEGIGLLAEDTSGGDGWSVTIPNPPAGTYIITAVATDNLGVSCTSDPIMVTVTDQTPVCMGGSAVTAEETAVSIALVATDDDPILTYVVVDAPMHGVVVLAGNVATYTPAPNFCGSDSFSYKAVDPCGHESAPCSVAIAVNGVPDAPVCAAASAAACAGSPVQIILSAADVDMGSCLPEMLSFAVVAPPAHGIVTIVGNVATYTSSMNYSGPDSFTFQVTDMYGLKSGVCTVSVAVESCGHPPVAVIKVTPTVDLGPSVPGVNVISPNNIGACVTLDGTQSSDVDNPFSDLSFTWLVDGMVVGTGPVLPDVCLLVGESEVQLIVSDGTLQGEAVQMVTVLTGADAIEELIMQVYDSTIVRKNKQPFIASLKSAAAAFERGSFGAGINKLEALIHKFEAQLKANPDIQAQWIKEVRSIIDGLNAPVTCDGCTEEAP